MSSELEPTEMIPLSPGVRCVNTIALTEEEKPLNQNSVGSLESEIFFRSKEGKELKTQKRYVHLFCRFVIV